MNILEYNCREGGVSTSHFNDQPLLLSVRPTQGYHTNLGRTVVLVHGYGGTFGKVKTAYEEMEAKIVALGLPIDTVVRFYWPGSWSKSIGFMLARGRVKTATSLLIRLLEDLNRNGATTITVQAHSLGCAIAQGCLEQYILPLLNVKYVYCSPAMTNAYFESRMQFEIGDEPRGTFPNLKIAYAPEDKVLKWFFRLAPGNWSSSAIGCGPSKKCLERPLCELKNFDAYGVKTHTGYRKVDEYYKWW